MSTYVVVIAHGTTGERLPNGSFSGKGGTVEYQAAITTNGIDRQPVGPMWPTPRKAYAYADKLEAQFAEQRDDEDDAA